MNDSMKSLKDNIAGRDTRNLLFFSIGRIISELGSSIFRFALSLYILDITGSPGMFSIILSMTILPGVLVNIFAGVFIDKSNKKKIMVLTDITSGVFVLVFTVLFNYFPKEITLFICYAIVVSVLQAFFSLTVNASIPELVSKDRVPAANSSSQSIGALVNIIGPILGAFAYSFLGLKMIFIIDGISFIAAGLLEMFIIFNKSKASANNNKSYFESFKEVYKYIVGIPAVKNLIVVFVLTNFFLATPIYVVLPYVVYKVLGLSAQQLGYMEAAMAGGIIVGALVVSMKKVNLFLTNKIFIIIQLQAVILILWGFAKLPFIDTDLKWLVSLVFIVLLAFVGLLQAMSNIPMISYVQLNIPENIRASFFGIISSLVTLAVPLGMWLFGSGLEHMDWIVFTIVPGLIMVVIAGLAHRNRELREFFSKKTLDGNMSIE